MSSVISVFQMVYFDVKENIFVSGEWNWYQDLKVNFRCILNICTTLRALPSRPFLHVAYVWPPAAGFLENAKRNHRFGSRKRMRKRMSVAECLV